MFGPRFNEQKLKVNLGLVVTRLKLIEKKKTDQALRARPEIADYVRNAKIDRARVRVESIIREDYLVEAMELVEMYADLLAGRVGLMKQSKTLDEGLKTPISTLIWAGPRLQQYCQEIKVVQDLLGAYYGKKYVEACRANSMNTVCERVIQKLDVRPPKKILVERYLIEICKAADVDFTPDPRIMAEEIAQDATLIDTDFMDFNRDDPGAPGGGSSGGSGGGGGQVSAPMPSFNYAASAPVGDFTQQPPAAYNPANAPSNNLPPYSAMDPNQALNPTQYDSSQQPQPKQPPSLPSKEPAGSPDFKVNLANDPSGVSANLPSYNQSLAPSSSSQPPVAAPRSSSPGLPNLPSVPTTFPGGSSNTPGNQSTASEDVDFDDLSRRFENLRKKT